MLRCGGCLFLGGGQIFISKSASLTHSLTHLARSNFCKLLRSRRFFFQDKCTSLLVEVLDLREMILNSQFVIFIPNSIVALSGKPSQPNQPLLKSQDMVHACLDYTLMPGPFTFGLQPIGLHPIGLPYDVWTIAVWTTPQIDYTVIRTTSVQTILQCIFS